MTENIDIASAASLDPELPHKERIDPKILAIAGVILLGMLMSILDTTVVGVAQHSWTKIFAASPSSVGWTQSAYTLALAAIIPSTSWITGKLGSRKTYMSALALFIVGSTLCAMSSNLSMLIFFRIIQGIGGGMLLPLGMTILTQSAGPGRLGKIMSLFEIPMLIAPTLGPVIGGWLVNLNWRWIFLINLPIGVITFVYAFFILPHDPDRHRNRLDVITLLLLSPGLVLFIFGLTQSRSHSFGSVNFLLPTLIGLALIIAAAVHALFFVREPLIEFRLLGNRNMAAAILTLFFYQISFFGVLFIVPQFCQDIFDKSPLETGVITIAEGIGSMLFTAISGSIGDRMDPLKLIMTGLVITCGGLLLLTLIHPNSSLWPLEIALFFIGAGAGIAMMQLYTAAFRTLNHEMIPSGSTLITISQQIIFSIGTALFTTLISFDMSALLPSYAHFQYAFIAASVICLLAFIPALFIMKHTRSIPREDESSYNA